MATANSSIDFFENLDDELNELVNKKPKDDRENTCLKKSSTESGVSLEQTIDLPAETPARSESDNPCPETGNESSDPEPIDVKQFM